MGTATQYWNAARGSMFMANNGITAWYELNATQLARTAQAMGLWDDVANINPIQAVDDVGLASRSLTRNYFLGIFTGWENSLPSDWTRVAVGDITDPNTLGLNRSWGANNRYHEVYIDTNAEGVWDFQLGSRAFNALVHELGHSIVGDHIPGGSLDSIMHASETNNSTTWYAATPMTFDIDRAIQMFGAATTRTGNDTYGFNASFSGAYREALDFSRNTRPLVTIYDSGGIDTFDASGFRDGFGNARSVHLDLNQGSANASRMLDGAGQTFGVIYTTSWIENGRTGEGNDELIGNAIGNVLTGNGGNDWFRGNGGNDTIFGGSGVDTAAYSWGRGTYTLGRNADGSISVVGARLPFFGYIDGIDTLHNVERLQFADGTFTLAQLGLDDRSSDTSTTGTVAVNGGWVYGNLEQSGDHDWYRVSLNAGTTYSFAVNGSDAAGGSLVDPYLRVFGPGLQLVAQNDDAGPGLSSLVTFTATASGTYYIDAGAFGDGSRGTYSVEAFAGNIITDQNDNLGRTLNGTAIADNISGLGGDDILNGLAGDDAIFGGFGNDRIDGGIGNDRLNGSYGDDRIVGGLGNDTINGGFGNDVLNGGLGVDTLTGGLGSDVFVFNTAIGAGNVDRITDFSVVADTIWLDNAVMPGLGLATGVLSAAAFHIGAAAADASDRIVYNAATGALFYDANGSAAGGVTQIAGLSAGLALTNADFLVF